MIFLKGILNLVKLELAYRLPVVGAVRSYLTAGAIGGSMMMGQPVMGVGIPAALYGGSRFYGSNAARNYLQPRQTMSMGLGSGLGRSLAAMQANRNGPAAFGTGFGDGNYNTGVPTSGQNQNMPQSPYDDLTGC